MASVEELFDEGNTELAMGELEKAAEYYRQCVKIDAQFFDGWHALGMVLMKSKQYEEAIEAGKKAIEIRPNDQMAYTSLSLAYVRNGQIKEAEDMGAKARILSWGGKVVKDNSKDETQ
ncbi:MAG: tetratricopeptide repeat protein [Verrucomicrobiota bacterium]